MKLKKIFTYIYVYISFLIILINYILRCKLNIKFFDKIYYSSNNYNNINENILYYLGHTILFFIYGIIFGIKNIYIIIFKILFFELGIILVKYCDDYKYIILNYHSILYKYIISVILSIIFYFIGSMLSNKVYYILNIKNKIIKII